MKGLYLHSKTGNWYTVIGTGKHTETQEEFVVYQRSGIRPSLPYQGIARRALVTDPNAPTYPREIDVSAVLISHAPPEEFPIWIRPLKMWDELVEVDGKMVPRFVKYVASITDEVDY